MCAPHVLTVMDPFGLGLGWSSLREAAIALASCSSSSYLYNYIIKINVNNYFNVQYIMLVMYDGERHTIKSRQGKQ